MASLPDQDVRERIQRDLSAALFVEAGAGTGKTTALVSRVLALVDAGVPVYNIAAITFTEAAAAELRDRVRIGLEDRVREMAGDVRDRAIAALEDLDGAALETLHSFSGRLLTLYPLEAGLPPRYRLLEDIGFSMEADREWDRVNAELNTDESLELPLTYALALGVKVEGTRYGEDLRGVFDRFNDNWDRLEPGPFVEEPFCEPDTSHLVDLLAGLLDRRGECTDTTDKLLEELDRLEESHRRIAHAIYPVQRARALATRPTVRRNVGRKEHWASKVSVYADIAAMLEEWDRLRGDLGAAALPPLLEHVRKAALDFAARRHREGLLGFQDLLVLARNLLRDHPEVRRELHERFTRILIDEFQDTDPLQADIADLLARPGDGSPMEAGRLFFVGDAKQSIYRFRRADIEMYQESRLRFECEPAGLVSNFRSSEAVIDFCNAAFRALLGEERPGQAGHQDLSPSRADISGGSVHLLGMPVEDVLADDLRRMEAEEIAAAVESVHEGRWQVFDRNSGQPRPARYDDIAVLIRSRNVLSALQRAFEDRDIPYRVESRSLVFNTQEIADLTNVLAAIDDPTDEVAVVAALRSPAFACGDDDLARHARSGGRWDYTLTPRPGDGDSPIAEGFDYLLGLHLERAWLQPGELVDRVIRERGLREIAFATRRPREVWQRYRFVLEQVRNLEVEQGANLRGLVSWLRKQAEEHAQVNESVAPEEDDDAVRVMTVHAAKGLEFPVTVLAGFGSMPRPPGRVLWPREGGLPAVHLGQAKTRNYDGEVAREKEFDAFERMRLLYVGSTRACDHLLVSIFHKHETQDLRESDAQKIFEVASQHADLWRQFESAPATRAASPTAAKEQGDRNLPPYEEWRASRETLLAAQARPRAMAATAIAHDDDKPEVTGDDPRDLFRRGRAATATGRAVHAVLQSVDLATGDNIDALAAAEAAAEGVPARAAEIAGLARGAIESATVREAVASGRYWREVFVAAPVGDVLVEGFVDLLYEGPQGLVVVDYKTDAVAEDEAVEAAADRYRLQGAAYALAIERTVGRPVVACRFLFLRPSGTRVSEVADLPAAIAEVEAKVAAGA